MVIQNERITMRSIENSPINQDKLAQRHLSHSKSNSIIQVHSQENEKSFNDINEELAVMGVINRKPSKIRMQHQ